MPSSPPPPIPPPDMRCIAHLDMDCFYAQVEAVRLGVDCRTTPFVCVQWGSFIAVNYPARALGVRRFRQTLEDVRKEHPDLKMGHIATYMIGELEYGYPDAPRINTHKVSLEPYRHASRLIFAILRSEPGVVVGKAGIDEAYIDVTEAAQRELAAVRAAAGGPDVALDALRDVMEPSTRLIGDRRAEMQAWFGERGTSLEAVFDAPMRALLRGERGRAVEGSRGFCVDGDDGAYAARCLLLCAASRVVHRLRQRIYAELHYDCSAGIAHNRVLAKCISATHKPNQQTLLLPDRSASALFELPLTRLRGFGGKFGAAVSAVCGGATDCRDLWMVPLPQLYALDSSAFAPGDDDDGGDDEDGGGSVAHARTKQRRIDATEPDRVIHGGGDRSPSGVAEYTFFRLRGVHGDKVADPALPRSMEASKIFHPSCESWRAARLWMPPLAAELWHRFRHYESCYYKSGRSVVVYFSTYVTEDERRHGWRSQSYRRHTALPVEIDGAAMLAEYGLRELEMLMRDVTKVDIVPFKWNWKSSRAPSTEHLDVSTAATTAATATCEEERQEATAPYDTEDDSKVPMPPLRVIGLSIIGLRFRSAGDEGAEGQNGGAAAVELPQRSLKDMFADISATHGASSKETTQRSSSEGRERKRARPAVDDALSVVEVDSGDEADDEVFDKGEQRPVDSSSAHINNDDEAEKKGLADSKSGGCKSHSSGGVASPPLLPPAPAPARRTLEDFFHHSPSAAAIKANAKSAKVTPAEEGDGDGADTAEVNLMDRHHHLLRSSTSVVEVSSDDDETQEGEATRRGKEKPHDSR
ncbi:putative DNA polymerase eta [Leptomonas pyrrhocoris]|uniref:Putative DNA polymerase eta n=1 Tax=Leptomonas pyrrhocoris TaxID=157538 RepID=A0A0N0DTZ3_LEPPY|nr:putative DNA polymerase eta [Leptomonas pyrrhocoris]KPA78188.1 putative DNA polymerase eta [Leptomonas pyrrhocoris]|eukprot:XP_015656627.1 putative DNA polymerase eta [Leptomonas pyrrhocoris]